MPSLIFGTYHIRGSLVDSSLDAAYSSGFRSIDTASLYENEAEIGSWHISRNIPRGSLFITTKVWPTSYRDISSSLNSSLKSLQTDYIDLFLLHWPVSLKSSNYLPDNSHIDRFPLQKVWAQMENLQRSGKVKHIGVSNWNVSLLNDLLSYAEIPPACNQFEMHLYSQKNDLIDFCNKSNILPVAYRVIFYPPKDPKYKLQDWTGDNELIKTLSEKYNKSAQQILIRWALQRNCGVVVKSSNPSRIQENWEACNFTIDESDMQALGQVKGRGVYTNSSKAVGLFIE